MKNYIEFDDLTPRYYFLITKTLILFSTTSLFAQDITGVPGSPDATRTIDGKKLPAPPLPFGGVSKENASQFSAMSAQATPDMVGSATYNRPYYSGGSVYYEIVQNPNQ